MTRQYHSVTWTSQLLFCLFCKWEESLQVKQPQEGQFKKCGACCKQRNLPLALITARAYLPKPSVCAGWPFLPTGGLQAECQLPQTHPRPPLTPGQRKQEPGQTQLSWKCTEPQDSDEQIPWIIGCCRDPTTKRGWWWGWAALRVQFSPSARKFAAQLKWNVGVCVARWNIDGGRHKAFYERRTPLCDLLPPNTAATEPTWEKTGRDERAIGILSLQKMGRELDKVKYNVLR